MFVCICKGITDSDIREAVVNGADDIAKVRHSLGVSSECGSCLCDAKMLVDETLAELDTAKTGSLYYAA